MTLGPTELAHLAAAAIEAARAAGRLIAAARPQTVRTKDGGHSYASQVVTEVDGRSQDLILGALGPTVERFGLGLLAEEQDDDGQRLTTPYFWCIDPLDGTLSFIEGLAGYSVSIALVARDGTSWIGVVYDPVESTLYHAVRGSGVFVNERPWALPDPASGTLSLFMDRSFTEAPSHADVLHRLRESTAPLGWDRVQLGAGGGAVINACRVLTHAPAAYFKFPKPQRGGGSLWDFAATACLLHEAGAIATDIHGQPLDLNRAESTFMSHRGALFASHAAIARCIRSL